MFRHCESAHKTQTNTYLSFPSPGYYVHLSTLAEVREQVLHYVPVMARPLVLGRVEHPIIWTPVYADVTVGNILVLGPHGPYALIDDVTLCLEGASKALTPIERPWPSRGWGWARLQQRKK